VRPGVAFALGVMFGVSVPLAGELVGSILAARAAARPWHRSDLLTADLRPSRNLGCMTTPASTPKGLQTGKECVSVPFLPVPSP